jgi:hypothetical protein
MRIGSWNRSWSSGPADRVGIVLTNPPLGSGADVSGAMENGSLRTRDEQTTRVSRVRVDVNGGDERPKDFDLFAPHVARTLERQQQGGTIGEKPMSYPGNFLIPSLKRTSEYMSHKIYWARSLLSKREGPADTGTTNRAYLRQVG